MLRGNRAPASALLSLLGLPKLARPQFGKCVDKDPRLAKVVRPVDPRIHFALVCGAKSCPPISVYTADNLDEGLAAAGAPQAGPGGASRVLRRSPAVVAWCGAAAPHRSMCVTGAACLRCGAGEAFCAGEVEVDKARRAVKLSMILKVGVANGERLAQRMLRAAPRSGMHGATRPVRPQWYSIDFGDNDTEKLRFVLQFLKVTLRNGDAAVVLRAVGPR